MKTNWLLVSVLFLSGCDGYFDKILDENPEAFNATFKLSFVESCIEPEKNDEKRAFCTCVAEDLVANHTPSQLMDEQRLVSYLEEVGFPVCMQKLEQQKVTAQ